MMITLTTRKLDVHDVDISDLTEKCVLILKVYKVVRNTFLLLPNPKYKQIIEQHQHLWGTNMNDRNIKPDLPIHMVLGASE